MTIDIFEQNLDRTIEDVEWFIKKFDYRYKDEPWKNSKDALVRTMYKTNGVTDEEWNKYNSFTCYEVVKNNIIK